MDKTKIAKMDMEAFRQLKDAEYELNKWRNLAGAMHQYIVDGNTAGALEAYEDVCDGLYDKVYESIMPDEEDISDEEFIAWVIDGFLEDAKNQKHEEIVIPESNDDY